MKKPAAPIFLTMFLATALVSCTDRDLQKPDDIFKTETDRINRAKDSSAVILNHFADSAKVQLRHVGDSAKAALQRIGDTSKAKLRHLADSMADDVINKFADKIKNTLHNSPKPSRP